MRKKYYAWFTYNDEEYVMRFRIEGSLRWDDKAHCFEDQYYYVRSFGDMVSYAAFDTHPMNLRHRFFCLKITHKEFVRNRSQGVQRKEPLVETIKWD